MSAEQPRPVRTVDLRPLEAPPFDAVLQALDDRPPDELVEILVGYAPVPLYDALEARGLPYEAVREGPDEWRVLVGRPLEHPVSDRRGRASGERLHRPRTERLPPSARP